MANIIIGRIVQESANSVFSVDMRIIGGAYEGRTITVSGVAFLQFLKQQIGRIEFPDGAITNLESQKMAA